MFAHLFSIPFRFVRGSSEVCVFFIHSIASIVGKRLRCRYFLFVFFFMSTAAGTKQWCCLVCNCCISNALFAVGATETRIYYVAPCAPAECWSFSFSHGHEPATECVCVLFPAINSHLTEHKRTEQLLTSTHRSLHHFNVVSWINATYSRWKCSFWGEWDTIHTQRTSGTIK